jgi:hypothetical protein
MASVTIEREEKAMSDENTLDHHVTQALLFAAASRTRFLRTNEPQPEAARSRAPIVGWRCGQFQAARPKRRA